MDGTCVFGVWEGYLYIWYTDTGSVRDLGRMERPVEELWLAPIRSSHESSGRYHLASVRADNPEGRDSSLTRIVDTITGREVFRLPEGFTHPSKTQWDGRYLLAVYNETEELLILDFACANLGGVPYPCPHSS